MRLGNVAQDLAGQRCAGSACPRCAGSACPRCAGSTCPRCAGSTCPRCAGSGSLSFLTMRRPSRSCATWAKAKEPKQEILARQAPASETGLASRSHAASPRPHARNETISHLGFLRIFTTKLRFIRHLFDILSTSETRVLDTGIGEFEVVLIH